MRRKAKNEWRRKAVSDGKKARKRSEKRSEEEGKGGVRRGAGNG